MYYDKPEIQNSVEIGDLAASPPSPLAFAIALGVALALGLPGSAQMLGTDALYKVREITRDSRDIPGMYCT